MGVRVLITHDTANKFQNELPGGTVADKENKTVQPYIERRIGL